MKTKPNNPRQIITQGSQFFSVPNDEEGQKFVEEMRTYINRSKTHRIRVKGRGVQKGKKANFWNDVRLKDAVWLAVYIDLNENTRSYIREQADKELKQQYDKYWILWNKFERMKGILSNLKSQIEKIEKS